MRRNFLGGFAALALASALAGVLPLIARTTKAEDQTVETRKDERGVTEEVMLDGPFAGVLGRTDAAIRAAGLVCVSEIDWSRVLAMREVPVDGVTPRLVAAPRKLRTFVVETRDCIEVMATNPAANAIHALELPGRFVIFEKEGKSGFMALRPHPRSGEAEEPEKVKEHRKDLERRLEKVLAKLKG